MENQVICPCCYKPLHNRIDQYGTSKVPVCFDCFMLGVTEYLRLHRLITQFSAVRVRDVMLETPDAWHAYLTELPEEFRVAAETIARTITHEYTTRMARLIETYERIAAETDSRKAFALEVQKQPAEDRSFLFSLFDGRSIDAKLLANVDLAALGLADLQAIEA